MVKRATPARSTWLRLAMAGVVALTLGSVTGLPPVARGETAELAVIVNPQAPGTKLGQAELQAIFSGVMRTWSGGTPVIVLNMPLHTPARTEFDRAVLDMTPEQAARFWLDKRIRGEGTPPKQIPSPEMIARLVAAQAGAISYVPAGLAGKGVRVVARIRGGEVKAP
jgi:ABC-type phosphate transport system substrate-binding protein